MNCDAECGERKKERRIVYRQSGGGRERKREVYSNCNSALSRRWYLTGSRMFVDTSHDIHVTQCLILFHRSATSGVIKI